MKKLHTFIHLWRTNKRKIPITFFEKVAATGVFNMLSDKAFLKLSYRIHLRKPLNLNNPISYNEKLQWLKLYDRNPEYQVMVDKYAVKQFVADRIGSEYIIPTLGVWDKVEDIDFDSLPNQFVLKWNHDSGSIVICKNKAEFDISTAKKMLSKGAKFNGFWYGREWPYINVKPRIIAEAYMEDEETKELRDYKVFTFNGKAKMFLIASERQKKGGDTKFDFFDTKFKHLKIVNIHENAKVSPMVPSCMNKILELSEKLAKGYPHIRVDFYVVNSKIYFGELTLYHGSGYMTFEPDYWYKEIGSWLVLPKQKRI